MLLLLLDINSYSYSYFSYMHPSNFRKKLAISMIHRYLIHLSHIEITMIRSAWHVDMLHVLYCWRNKYNTEGPCTCLRIDLTVMVSVGERGHSYWDKVTYPLMYGNNSVDLREQVICYHAV